MLLRNQLPSIAAANCRIPFKRSRPVTLSSMGIAHGILIRLLFAFVLLSPYARNVSCSLVVCGISYSGCMLRG